VKGGAQLVPRVCRHFMIFSWREFKLFFFLLTYRRLPPLITPRCVCMAWLRFVAYNALAPVFSSLRPGETLIFLFGGWWWVGLRVRPPASFEMGASLWVYNIKWSSTGRRRRRRRRRK
jgi:hypothetical protein